MKKGTLLIVSGTESDPNKKHLFTVLTDPDPNGDVLLASFSTYRDEYYCDETCIVEEGESGHPFLKVKSFVRYQKLMIKSEASIISGIDDGTVIKKPDLHDTVFSRVKQGVYDSRFSAPKYKKFLARDDARGQAEGATSGADLS